MNFLQKTEGELGTFSDFPNKNVKIDSILIKERYIHISNLFPLPQSTVSCFCWILGHIGFKLRTETIINMENLNVSSSIRVQKGENRLCLELFGSKKTWVSPAEENSSKIEFKIADLMEKSERFQLVEEMRVFWNIINIYLKGFYLFVDYTDKLPMESKSKQ